MNKLLTIQTELKAPKGQYNSFGGYNYRSAEDILEAVKPLLKKHECDLVLWDEIVEVGGRVYVKASAKFSDGDKETIITAYAREAESKKGMDESQVTGTASSYARKYCLNGLFLIDDTKDADTEEYQKQTKKAAQAPKKSSPNGLDFADLWEKYKKMGKEELRKEYAEVKNYVGYSDKQKEAILNIIERCSEKK